MKFKEHANQMSHLLLAEKHHRLFLRNADSRPVREIHNTTAVSAAYSRTYSITGPVPAPRMRGLDVAAAAQQYALATAADVAWRGPVGVVDLRGLAGAAGWRAHAADTGSKDFADPASHHAEAYAAEASRRPPRGSFRRPQPKPQRGIQKRTQTRPRFPPRPFINKPAKGNCHKCGRKGHFVKECRAPPYLVNMYKELQHLRIHPRQNYNFQTENPLSSTHDLESFMNIYEKQTSNPDVALLDNASTHTILTNLEFFHFTENEKS